MYSGVHSPPSSSAGVSLVRFEMMRCFLLLKSGNGDPRVSVPVALRTRQSPKEDTRTGRSTCASAVAVPAIVQGMPKRSDGGVIRAEGGGGIRAQKGG